MIEEGPGALYQYQVGSHFRNNLHRRVNLALLTVLDDLLDLLYLIWNIL